MVAHLGSPQGAAGQRPGTGGRGWAVAVEESSIVVICLILRLALVQVLLRGGDPACGWLLGGTGSGSARQAVAAILRVDGGRAGASAAHEQVALPVRAAVHLLPAVAGVRRGDHAAWPGRIRARGKMVTATAHVVRSTLQVGWAALILAHAPGAELVPAARRGGVTARRAVVLIRRSAAAAAARHRNGVLVVASVQGRARMATILLPTLDRPLSHVLLGARDGLILARQVDVVVLGNAYVAIGGL